MAKKLLSCGNVKYLSVKMLQLPQNVNLRLKLQRFNSLKVFKQFVFT